MSIERFVKDFEDAIGGIEKGSFSPDTEFHTLKEWDSLAVSSVMAMIDSEYNVTLTVNEIRECNTLKDLFAKIKSKSE